MHIIKFTALSSAIFVMVFAPMAEAAVKDKDFVKMSVSEQADTARLDYFKRLRLMGADPELAKKLSYSSYFDRFLSNRQAWASLKTRYKKTKKIPGKKVTKALIGGGAGDRVNYSLEVPTYLAANGTEKPLADITQEDVDLILKDYNSDAEVRAMIAGTRPFTENISIPVNSKTEAPSSALITPKINSNLKDPMTGKTVNTLTQAVAYADAVTRVCDLKMPMETRMQLEGGIIKYQIRVQKKTAAEVGTPGLGYMLALTDSGLLTGKGGGNKSKAKEICTDRVRSELLNELETVAKGDLGNVSFLKPYL